MIARAPWRSAMIAALASAMLLWLASPSAGGPWWLAWIALVPAAWAAMSLPGRIGRIAVPLALALYMETQLIPALPFGLAEGQWGDPPLPILVGDSPVIIVALVAIPLFGALLYLLPLRPPPAASAAAAILVPAVALAAVEFARANLDPGGLWGTLALTQAGGEGARVAAIAGPWLLAFLIAAVNYAIAVAIARRSPRLLAVPGAALALAFAASGLGTDGASGEPIRVAAIQPGYDTAEEDREVLRRWEPGSYPEAALDVIGDLAPLTERAADAGADLVVWPEATTFVDPGDDSSVAGLVSRLALENETAIVYPHFDYDESRSAVSVVGPDGTVRPSRPKQRAMWFLGERADDAGPEPFAVGELEIGTLLGVDAQDADIAAELAEGGADLLVSATHDWEGMATQQLDQARLLARATGVGVVRADWRYRSAVIGTGGEVLAQADSGKRRALVIADLPTANPTWYASIGGIIGWLSVLSLAAVASRAAWPSSRSRGPRQAWPRQRPSPAPPRVGRAPTQRLP